MKLILNAYYYGPLLTASSSIGNIFAFLCLFFNPDDAWRLLCDTS
jgi:hypothetical protein